MKSIIKLAMLAAVLTTAAAHAANLTPPHEEATARPDCQAAKGDVIANINMIINSDDSLNIEQKGALQDWTIAHGSELGVYYRNACNMGYELTAKEGLTVISRELGGMKYAKTPQQYVISSVVGMATAAGQSAAGKLK